MTKRRRITFTINDTAFTRWYGTTVEAAVIAYDQRILKDIRAGRAWVVDARGDRVDLDGTLQNGVRLYVKYDDEDLRDP